MIVSIPLYDCKKLRDIFQSQGYFTYPASNVEVWLILQRALEHAAIILNKEVVNSCFSPRIVRVFDQCLRVYKVSYMSRGYIHIPDAC